MMKHRLSLLLLAAGLCFGPIAAAQIYISSDLFNPVQGTVQLRVLEKGSETPVSYASVYLQARGDTLITNFTLTDTAGVAKLEKVTRGTYNLTVEMLGYKSLVKEHYFSFTYGSEKKDLGVVYVEEDHEMLEASHVTAIGNPVEIRQDTIIFNAASFQVGQNQMLEDLLKRMPGMEVTDDGVKYNGESIQKITVGGKTFFFDDPKMALKNLPARVVDKVKVIDKVSDSEQFTGVATDREKVMDLDFKQEFKKGWFGNVLGGLGATMAGDRKEELIDDRGLIYTGNGMVSGYTEKDQVTIVANAANAPIQNDGAVIFIRVDGDEAYSSGSGGITTSQNAGVNFNTQRIQKLETTAMARYKHELTNSESKSSRTTFITDGSDIASETGNQGILDNNDFRVGFELKNTSRKKLLFNLEPQFNYTLSKNERYNENHSRNVDETTTLNRSSSSNYGESKQFSHSSTFSIGIRQLGNPRRSMTLSGNWLVMDTDGDSREFSRTWTRSASEPVTKDLFYVTDNRNYGGRVNFSYIEPIAKLWVLSVDLAGSATIRDNSKDAFNRSVGAAGFNASVLDKGDYRDRNDYYSTLMNNRYYTVSQTAQFQYKKEQTSVQLGVQLQESLNETRSRSLGQETETGIGEWLFDWSPYINLRWGKMQRRFSFNYNGRSSQPLYSNQLPVLDISVPTRQRAGNIYLRPSFRHHTSFNISLNNPEKQWNAGVNGGGSVNLRSVVTASWFDSNGIQYSIPVNSGAPSYSLNLFANWSGPLTPDKKLRLTFFLSATGTRSVSYQNIRRLEGLDSDNFDYNAFMAWFWGDSSGDLFYSGKSGFSESLTNVLSLTPRLGLSYRGEQVTASVSGSTTYNASHYSLDGSADTRTWSSTINGRFEWSTAHQWELSTDAAYRFFYGFPEGYHSPYVSWNAGVTKNIKAFAISIKINDILNSTRSTRHTINANYVEDSMWNALGRYFYITLKWNFGKLNAAKSSTASRASMRLQL